MKVLQRLCDLCLIGVFALGIVGCNDSGEGFEALEEASAFLTAKNVEIVAWYPQDDVVVVPAVNMKTFGVTTNAEGGGSGLVFTYLVDGTALATGSEPFFNLTGSLLPGGAQIFTIQVTDGVVTDSHDFPIAVNQAPVFSATTPSEKSVVADCGNPLLIFTGTASDPEGGELTFEWTLNDGLLDETVFVETTETQS
ncbi:MAG: hypothetical protein HRU19_25035 [Pseudobacteriovorax sp.]|nr:hypothetical protein [Pseudobacteriovorax sp.]